MVDSGSHLVPKEKFQEMVAEYLRNEQEIAQDLETILPHVHNEKMKKSFEDRLRKGKDCIRALQEGFVPVEGGWMVRTDTKSKWLKKEVARVLKGMPPEIREVWEKVEKLGIFKSFSVSVSGGGDPMLVGNVGGKHFFLAGWLDFGRGITLGLRMKL